MVRLDAREEDIGHVVEEVAAVIFGGGTVIFPTDTVYGIGCDPMAPRSIERIFSLKIRPKGKPLSLHLATVEELLEYAPGNAIVEAFARRFLPGPLTIIVKRPSSIDERVNAGLPSIGLRVPNHMLCAAILERCGPLAATSANLSGQRAFMGDDDVHMLPKADLFVDAGPTPFLAESTVVDLSSYEGARLIREGVISAEMIEQQICQLSKSLS